MFLESSCNANRPDDQCKDGNAECKDATDLKCLCKDTFYKNKDGNCTKSKFCIFTHIHMYRLLLIFSTALVSWLKPIRRT